MAGRLSGRRQDQWKTTELNDETVTHGANVESVVLSSLSLSTFQQQEIALIITHGFFSCCRDVLHCLASCGVGEFFKTPNWVKMHCNEHYLDCNRYNITEHLLVMRYITALQQIVIHYCNYVTFVTRYSQH